MSPLSVFSRRRIMQWSLASAGAPLLARVLGAQRLPGGGQLEIRLVQSMYTSDADELEVAQRARPYDPDSWYTEWTRVAEKNEKLADGYAADGLRSRRTSTIAGRRTSTATPSGRFPGTTRPSLRTTRRLA